MTYNSNNLYRKLCAEGSELEAKLALLPLEKCKSISLTQKRIAMLERLIQIWEALKTFKGYPTAAV
jgi:hypothetical protein